MEPTIKACAKLASAKPYTYFAIQFYGECWGGEASAATTYYIDGPSDNCYAGTGGHDTNYVYHLGRRTGTSLQQNLAYESLYCSVLRRKVPDS